MSSMFLQKFSSLPKWSKLLIAIAILLPLGLVSFPRSKDEWELAQWQFHDTTTIHDIHSTNQTNMELLFVGNSYTSVNDLAFLVKQIIDTQKYTNTSIRSHHPGGQTFLGHIQSTKEDYVPPYGPDYPELHELREWLLTKPRNYNWVVLQEQSQIPGFGGIETDPASSFNASLDSCQQLDELVQKIPRAQTLFYLTWGRRNGDEHNPEIYPDYLTHQRKLNHGYEEYRKATCTVVRPTYVAPVGLVYHAIYEADKKKTGKDPSLNEKSLFYQLYAGDGSHPSIAGSYLAALTMYSSMLGDDPRAVKWIPEDLDPARAKTIQRAVAWTIMKTTTLGFVYPWQGESNDELP